MGVRWRGCFLLLIFHLATSFSPASPSFIECSAPNSLPHHILRLHVIMKTLSSPFTVLFWHLSSFQGCRLQEDIWQVWRWLRGNYRHSGAGHAHQGSWVGEPFAFYQNVLNFTLIWFVRYQFISTMQTEPVWRWGGSDPERNWRGWKRGNWLWRIPLNNEVRPTQVVWTVSEQHKGKDRFCENVFGVGL